MDKMAFDWSQCRKRSHYGTLRQHVGQGMLGRRRGMPIGQMVLATSLAATTMTIRSGTAGSASALHSAKRFSKRSGASGSAGE